MQGGAMTDASTFSKDLPSHRRHRVRTPVQAQPGAAFLGGETPFENALHLIGIDTGAVVGEAEVAHGLTILPREVGGNL